MDSITLGFVVAFLVLTVVGVSAALIRAVRDVRQRRAAGEPVREATLHDLMCAVVVLALFLGGYAAYELGLLTNWALLLVYVIGFTTLPFVDRTLGRREWYQNSVFMKPLSRLRARSPVSGPRDPADRGAPSAKPR